MRIAKLGWLGAALLAACTAQGPATVGGDNPNPGSNPPGSTVPTKTVSTANYETGLTFGDNRGLLMSGQSQSSFNFVTLRTLFVRVIVSAVPDSTIMHLTFTNPRGEIFYQDNAPFSTGSAGSTMMPGMDHPSQVTPVVKLPNGKFALDRGIPIAGSIFQRYPSDGDWPVQAAIDNAAGPFTATLHVENHR
jgi:hypothetical protein